MEKKRRIHETDEILLGFFGKLKIFGWYLKDELFQVVVGLYRALRDMVVAMNRPLTWVYSFIVIILTLIYLGDRGRASIMLLLVIVLFIVYEWNRGHYIYRYRQEIKRRARLNGGKKDELDNLGTGEHSVSCVGRGSNDSLDSEVYPRTENNPKD